MIEFKNVGKKFGKKEVIHSVSMKIPKGEIVSLIGASGCGKTTLLKMINRLIPISSGEILLDGENIYNMKPVELRRKIGYVIQQTGLFPHQTVRGNLELVLDLHKIPKEGREEKMQDIMKTVGLSVDLLDSYPSELSGGQQQRVGVARALIIEPKVILMDEPFSAIDPITRSALQDELRQLQETVQKTIVFVTHDMDEAIKISDRICLLREGNIEQYDTPEGILRNPATKFVEDFIGKNRIWSSPEFIKAKDMLIEATNLCRPHDSLIRCMKKINDQPYDYLIVVDPLSRTFGGLISEQTIREQDTLEKSASDIAVQPMTTANIEASLPEIMQMVKDMHKPYIVVVDDENRYKGIITQSSLVATLGSQYIDDEEVV